MHSTAHKNNEYATNGNNSGGEDISIANGESELHSREYLSVNQTGISANQTGAYLYNYQLTESLSEVDENDDEEN